MTLMPAGKNCAGNPSTCGGKASGALWVCGQPPVWPVNYRSVLMITKLAESSCWLQSNHYPLCPRYCVQFFSCRGGAAGGAAPPFLGGDAAGEGSPTISVGCCLYDSCQPLPASAPRFPLARTSSFIKTVQAINSYHGHISPCRTDAVSVEVQISAF